MQITALSHVAKTSYEHISRSVYNRQRYIGGGHLSATLDGRFVLTLLIISFFQTLLEIEVL